MTVALLLDEHYSETIASRLRAHGHDVLAVEADPELRAQADPDVYRRAAASHRRIVTENIKDFRPLLQQAYADGHQVARLLLVPPGRFPRARGRRTTAIVAALDEWLSSAGVAERPDEDWLAQVCRRGRSRCIATHRGVRISTCMQPCDASAAFFKA